jgi:hypothetical protein
MIERRGSGMGNRVQPAADIKAGFGCRIVRTPSSAYGHQFGGGQEYRGTVPPGGQTPIQLIFRLNLRDPLSPIQIDGLNWLPLFYPFQYNACGMGYRVLGELEIEILTIETIEVVEDFPFPNYPAAFPNVPVSLVPMTYEETKVLAFGEYLAKNLLWNELQDDDRAIIDSIGKECTRIGSAQSLVQGESRFRDCPAKCRHYLNSLRPFCTIWNEPIKGMDVWQTDSEPIQIIQIIHQVCSNCGAIQTENQCT